jgi:hypothetical protein
LELVKSQLKGAIVPEHSITIMKEMPVACELPEDAQAERKEEIEESIWTGVEEKLELPDGYAFRFPGTDEWAGKLEQFVRFERKCCRFILFELAYEQDEGPIWLRLRGGQGTKEFIESM